MAPLNQIKSKKPLWPFGANMMHDVVCNVSVTGKVVRQLFFFFVNNNIGIQQVERKQPRTCQPTGKVHAPLYPFAGKRVTYFGWFPSPCK